MYLAVKSNSTLTSSCMFFFPQVKQLLSCTRPGQGGGNGSACLLIDAHWPTKTYAMNVREGEWKSCVATKLHCQVQNVMAERLSCSKSCRPGNKRHFIYGIACSMLYLPPPSHSVSLFSRGTLAHPISIAFDFHWMAFWLQQHIGLRVLISFSIASRCRAKWAKRKKKT